METAVNNRLGPRPHVANERLRHRLIGYARVSKADGSQSLDLQRDALRAAGVDAGHVYHDVASGVRDDRPGLDSCVRALRTGDVLVVWKLARLGRTLAHLVNTVQDLSARGVGLRVLTGHGAQIDTTTAAGRLVFGIFAALAEFERELVRERTLAGLTAARAAGRSRCRKPRCGWPRPRWRTATPPCPRSAATSARLGSYPFATGGGIDAGGATGWDLGDDLLGFSDPTWVSLGSGIGVLPIAVKGYASTTTTNTAPVFATASVTRTVPENSPANTNVGAVVTATDDDSDTLTYTIGGTDAASFSSVATSGQIRTTTAVTYDYETKDAYAVVVTADDGNGGTDTINVLINLTDVDEPQARPAAPTVSATTGSTTSLDVSWTAPTNTGRPAITSYDLQYRKGTTGSFTDGPQDVTGTSATISGLDADSSYQVQVRATNAEGDSDWSLSGTGQTAAAVVATCAVPSLTGRTQIWTGMVTVEAITTGGTTVGYGFSASFSDGNLDDKQFSLGTNNYTVDGAGVEVGGMADGMLNSA